MGSSSSKFDVFLSFRGEDTRDNFTSHLYTALQKKKIKTYMDDNMKKGDEISPTLFKAIKRAKLSVIVFSENYASSSWCLDELVKILECKEKNGQIVVPIFYGVDPSDVRKQKGSYALTSEGFKGRKKRGVEAWREALKKTANLSGWDSRTIRPESKLIEAIVKDVRKKLEVLQASATAAITVGVVAANVATASAAGSVAC